MRHWVALAVAANITFACRDAGREGDPSTAGSGIGPGADGGSGDGADAGDDDDDEAADSGGSDGGSIKLDVAAADDGADDGGVTEGPCKIDFLFVVDKSSSMTSKQENLVQSFPGFVDEIEMTEEAGDGNFHVLVTHTDTIGVYNIDPYCSWECDTDEGTCPLDGSACAFVNDTSCLDTCREDIDNTCANGMDCRDLLPECGECGCTLGAGRIEDMNDAACGVEGGHRYLQSGQSDLEETFACVAEVGISGARERQADALLEAIAPEHVGAGGCNEGFLRPDAILVVTLITDEEDGELPGTTAEWNLGSDGTPAQWKDAVVAAKAGDEEAVVVLGLLGDLDQPDPLCECPLEDFGCEGTVAEPSPILREFVTSFPRHVVASVCEPTYGDFFAEAVQLIDQTCADFEPPG